MALLDPRNIRAELVLVERRISPSAITGTAATTTTASATASATACPTTTTKANPLASLTEKARMRLNFDPVVRS
jgi:hypothetical protein